MRQKNFYTCLTMSFCFALMMNYSNQCKAQEIDYKSYSVYVYNFIKYIEWPEASKKGDFVIGIIGDSPVIGELKKLAVSKKANGQTITIKKFSSIAEVSNCQILYISSSKSGTLKEALEKIKNMPTLLVTEREGLARKGAGINFVTMEDETLKFELNKKAIESHNLQIASVLVTLGIPIR